MRVGRRNDIRLAGSAARGHTNVDYDIKVHSLVASQANVTTARKPDNISFIDHSLSQRNKQLVSVAKSADAQRP